MFSFQVCVDKFSMHNIFDSDVFPGTFFALLLSGAHKKIPSTFRRKGVNNPNRRPLDFVSLRVICEPNAEFEGRKKRSFYYTLNR